MSPAVPPAPEPADAPPPLVPCVGAVVRDAVGRLLLVRRGHDPGRGLWSIPGGRVEAGESLAAAIEREVMEETGLTVQAGEPVGRVLIPAPGAVYEVVDLDCTLLEPDERPVAGDDADDVAFVAPEELDRLACTSGLLDTLRRWGVLPG